MSKNLLSSILKQHNIGIWWGALRNTISNATMYLSLFNTALIVPMAYVSWFQPWVASAGIDISFPLFILGIFALGVVVLLVEYKLFTPSNFEFWGEQFWKHGSNPMNERMDRLEKKVDELKGLLSKYEKGN